MLRCRRSGHVLLELVLACVLIIPLSIVGCSLLVVEIAVGSNDRICRNSCRAAAEASDATTSLKLAQAVVATQNVHGAFYGPVTLNTGQFVYQDYAGSTPEGETPYVSVTTQMPCTTPAPVRFISSPFGVPGTITFVRTYRFPIVKLKLYLPE
jgi:hypothetical protein